ncbi:MAG: leucine-rich repeat protein [Oscillospiraceae bacterium]|nr:leucine-rich repeat protein [Oscillospiraceae bacterium]
MQKKRVLSAITATVLLLTLAGNTLPLQVFAADSADAAPQDAISSVSVKSSAIRFEAEETDPEPEESGNTEAEPALQVLQEAAVSVQENDVETPAEDATSGTFTEDVSWRYDTETKTFYLDGSGSFTDYGNILQEGPWRTCIAEAQQLIISAEITYVPNRLFYACESVEKLTLPTCCMYPTENEYYSTRGWTTIGYFFNSSSKITSEKLTEVTVTGGEKIPKNFFENCAALKKITLSDSVTVIESSAFSGCKSLEEIVWPKELNKISSGAFQSCTALTSAAPPDTVTVIEENAFNGCSSLAEIRLPASLRTIDSNAFANCALQNMSVSAEIQSVATNAFNGNADLTEMTIPLSFTGLPDTVTSVVFAGGTVMVDKCISGRKNLKSVKLPDGMTAIGAEAFSGCTGLETIVLPDTVESIGSGAFKGCTGLTEITLPDSVQTVGSYAFSGCTALKSAAFGKSLESLGEEAFSGCAELTKIALPKNLKTLGNLVFQGCTGLTALVIPDSVNKINGMLMRSDCNLTAVSLPFAAMSRTDDRAGNSSVLSKLVPTSAPLTSVTLTGGRYLPDSYFSGFSGLTEIVLPDTLLEIGNKSFSGLTALESVVLPKNLTTVGEQAFKGCTALKEITFPDTMYKVKSEAFAGTAWLEAQKEGLIFAGKVVLGYNGTIAAPSDEYEGYALVLAKGTLGVADYAFQNRPLIGLELPEGLLYIGSNAFSRNSNLKEVTIPETVTEIGSYAFSSCSNLKSITVPDSVTVIGAAPFGDGWAASQEEGPVYIGKVLCAYNGDIEAGTVVEVRPGTVEISDKVFAQKANLAGVVLPDSLEKIGAGAFNGCTGLLTVSVPDSVTFIGNEAFRGCTAMKEIHLPEGLTAVNSAICYQCSALTEITVPANVQMIAGNAFGECPQLKKITLPGTVEADYTAFGCSTDPDIRRELVISAGSETVTTGIKSALSKQIEKVTLPDGLKSVGKEAFRGYTLTEINIPDTVTEIGEGAFREIKELKSVHLSEKLETVGNYAFYSCTALSEINIPETLIAVKEGAFKDCCKITVLTLPESLKQVGDYAFSGIGIKKIVLPESVVSYGKECFAYCEYLKEITFAESMTVVSEGMFRSCTMLTELVIPEQIVEFRSNAFADCKYLSHITVSDNFIRKNISSAFSFHKPYNSFDRTVTVTGNGVEVMDELHGELAAMILAFSPTIIEMKNHVKTVSFYTFSNRAALPGVKKVILPDTVTTIGKDGFLKSEQLETVVIPASLRHIEYGAFMDCTSLRELTLPDEVTELPMYMCRGCTSLVRFHSNVEYYDYPDDAFIDCPSLKDLRLLKYNPDKFSMSLNTSKAIKGDIFYLTLRYELTPAAARKTDTVDFRIDFSESGVAEVAAEYLESCLSGVSSEIQVSNLGSNSGISVRKAPQSAELRIPIRVIDYSNYTVTARWNIAESCKAVFSVMPICIGTDENPENPVSVFGHADPDTDVTLYLDDAEVSKVHTNAKTGKYSTKIELPEKEDSTEYVISAEDRNGNVDSVTVNLDPNAPRVQKVILNKIDITKTFTEGATPVISYNPRNPFCFDITVSHPERVSNVYVLSWKGEDVKYLKGEWSPLTRTFHAYGFFDPSYIRYVPGQLEIVVQTGEATLLNIHDNTLAGGNTSVIDACSEDITDETQVPEERAIDINKIEAPLSQAVMDHSTENIKYLSEDAIVDDVTISDGIDSVDWSFYHEFGDTVCIDEENVTSDEIAADPAAYGFKRNPLYTYDPVKNEVIEMYTKPIYGVDLALQVKANYDKNIRKDEKLEDTDLGDLAKFVYGYGMAVLYVRHLPKSRNAPKTVYDVVSDVNDGLGGNTVTGVSIGAATNGAVEFVSRYEVTVKNVPIGENIGTFANTIGTTVNIIGTGVDAYDGYKRFNEAEDLDQKTETCALFAWQTAVKWGTGPLVGAALTALGVTPVGWGVLGAIALVSAATFVGNMIADNWKKDLDRRIAERKQKKASAQHRGGNIKWSVDPSGYVFEAVDSNRLTGATMTIYYQDPETGEAVEWLAGEYEQLNPLLTDANGKYAWDVPEGLWRVKFELEGYETVYSEWMTVPPIRTNVNFSAVSKEVPQITSLIEADGKLILTFSKYMDISTLNADTVTVSDGKAKIPVSITPVKTDEADSYACRFELQAAENAVMQGSLTVSLSDKCLSYCGTAIKVQEAKVTVPEEVVMLEVDSDTLLAAQKQVTEITLKAVPGSLAAGKEVTMTDPLRLAELAEPAAFDETGTAVVKIKTRRTGESVLTFGVAGERITTDVTLMSVQQESFDSVTASEKPAAAAAVISGDFNNDNEISVADAVILARFIQEDTELTAAQVIRINNAKPDRDGDGFVTILDVYSILKAIAA